MIGIATRLSMLKLLRNNLAASADPAMQNFATLIDQNPGWANFGALGPAFADVLPPRIAVPIFGQPGTSGYAELWKRIFFVYGGDGTPAAPGLRAVLDRIRDLLSRLEQITADQDLDALQAMEGEVGALPEISTQLTDIINSIKGDGTLANIGLVGEFSNLISVACRPAIVRERVDGGIGFPAKFWNLRDVLSWRRTGRFAKQLWDKAQGSGDPTLMAYALGWISSWSVSAGGASAVASIIGAPFRNQWWRARFVANYVDVWAFGHAEVGPATAPYAAWPQMCSANLQDRIMVPGPAFDITALMDNLRLNQPLQAALPASFTAYWLDCYETVYAGLDGDRPAVTAEFLQDAFAFTWLVLWFQTSPQSLGCHHTAPATPGACGTPPAWVTAIVSGGGSGGITLPPPTIDPKIKPENIICAILLAILGIAALCGGMLIGGAAAIAGAVALIASAGTIDWAKFGCDLAWYRLTLFNGLRALHDLLSLGGFVHPYKHELSQDSMTLQLLGALDVTWRTGDNILISKPHKETFPALPWNGSGFEWFDEPSGPAEQPATVPTRVAAYPSGFLDDPANPFGPLNAFDPQPYPFAADGSGRPLGNINAVSAAMAWLQGGQGAIPDLNLDGDRGAGFRGWRFTGTDWTNPISIQEED